MAPRRLNVPGRQTRIALVLLCLGVVSAADAQTTGVEFGRDVQPVLRERCYNCHGSSQQLQGLRLDQRRSAMPNRVGANRASIVPGNSAASSLYLRLAGKQGLQMPPDAPLPPEQIERIRRWIDEGADWPDALSGDRPASPPDARVEPLFAALRAGDGAQVRSTVQRDPSSARLKGANGTTPLMYASLYGDVESLRLLLRHGADVNSRNDAGVTALMYAIDDLAMTRLLLDGGADANARSEDGQTPLLLAAARPGSGAVVKLLLERGANPSATSVAGRTALVWAAVNGDADLMKTLLDRGVPTRPLPLAQAVRARCAACVELLLPLAQAADLSDALTQAAALGDFATMRTLIARGAKAGPGMLPSLAVSPYAVTPDFLQQVIAAGADVSASTRRGGTILDFARRHGDTPLVGLLRQAGAKELADASAAPRPSPATSLRAAVDRSLPLLDRADVAFIRKAGCASCHNNALAGMTRSVVRSRGMPIDEAVSRSQVRAIAAILEGNRERALQALPLPGGWDTAGYLLLGLAAENYRPDETTDAWARYLKNSQLPDGHWIVQGQRPPLEASDIQTTATAMRALQVYAPPAKRREYERAIQRSRNWLTQAQPVTTEDRAFQILGLHWAGERGQPLVRAAKALLEAQRADGGWAQTTSLTSDAYATGQALFALGETGLLSTTDERYRRGTQFLINSQLEDGSWYVRTRAIPAQPHFDSEFPHDVDQFISAAATHWATMALARARQE